MGKGRTIEEEMREERDPKRGERTNKSKQQNKKEQKLRSRDTERKRVSEAHPPGEEELGSD